jgi:ABC-type methionine transport system ATPase subunit
MKKFMLSFLALSLFNVAFAQHDGHALTNAKIAHDASHRIGRLVDTGKIDELFLKNMNSLEVTAISHTEHTDPAFSVTASATSGTSQTVLTFDMMGKFLSNKVMSQTAAEVNPYEVDAAEILEAALHYTMEGTNTTLDMTPFNKDMLKATLNQNKNDDATVSPVVTITSSSSSKVLRIVLSTKGEVVSSSLVE